MPEEQAGPGVGRAQGKMRDIAAPPSLANPGDHGERAEEPGASAPGELHELTVARVVRARSVGRW